MKLKIKVKELTEGCMPEVIEQGDWIDLKTAEKITFTGSEVQSRKLKFIPLGVAMELPKGFEAYILPRSSTPKKWSIELANSQGVIDESYKGDNDEWKYIAKAFKATTIPKGTRICQFRIMPKMKASVWTKIKWLFVSKIEFVKVDTLNNTDRKGIGSTGD